MRMQEILGPKFKPWRVHDLRRTCATGMENLGIDTRIVETALIASAAQRPALVGVYRAAPPGSGDGPLQSLGRTCPSLTGSPLPSNVVPLKRKAV